MRKLYIPEKKVKSKQKSQKHARERDYPLDNFYIKKIKSQQF